MTEILTLPPGVALGIIAFLLSLLPAGLFMWIWYLRHHARPVPPLTVALAFGAGLLLVLPAFFLERVAGEAWQAIHPATAHYFNGAVLPLQSIWDLLLPAAATFLVVATVEEGLRYILLQGWLRFSSVIDQAFDGMVVGIAAGLGFATLENTLYFFNLFEAGSFDTLVFVFFLRFLISTLAHISFGGLMGLLIARGVFEMYGSAGFYLRAFFLPWFLHGFYDFLLGINQSLYAVLILLPPLTALIVWSTRHEFLKVQRKNGKVLVIEESPAKQPMHATASLFHKAPSPWNVHAPWLGEAQLHKTILRKEQGSSPSL